MDIRIRINNVGEHDPGIIRIIKITPNAKDVKEEIEINYNKPIFNGDQWIKSVSIRQDILLIDISTVLVLPFRKAASVICIFLFSYCLIYTDS